MAVDVNADAETQLAAPIEVISSSACAVVFVSLLLGTLAVTAVSFAACTLRSTCS